MRLRLQERTLEEGPTEEGPKDEGGSDQRDAATSPGMQSPGIWEGRQLDLESVLRACGQGSCCVNHPL